MNYQHLLLLTLGFSLALQGTTLSEVEVIGHSPTATQEMPGSADVISEETLQRAQPLTTGEALMRVPGVSVRNEDGLGLRPNISIRGINGNRSKKVLLLEDGLPIALAPYGESSAYYSPQIDRIARIEVLKGSGSILYGPQTIGGVVNFITAEPPSSRTVKTTLAMSSFDTNKAQVHYGNRWGDHGLLVNYLRRSGQGFRSPMPFDIHDVSIKYGFTQSERSELSLRTHYYTERSASTYTGLTESMFQEDPRQNPAIYDRLYVERAGVRLGHRYYTDFALIHTNVYGYHTSRNWWRQDFTRSNTLVPEQTNKGNNRYYTVAGLENRIEWDALTVGARVHHEFEDRKKIIGASPTARSGSLNSHEHRSTDAVATYAQYQYAVNDRVDIIPGLRLEHYQQRRAILVEGDQAKHKSGTTQTTAWIPGIGATAYVTDQVQVFGGVHRGFAPASFGDALDINGQDQQLDPEESWNYEAGIRGALSEHTHFTSTAFFTDYFNQVVATSGTYTKANGGRSQTTGVELGLQYTRPLPNGFQLTSSAGLTLQTAIYTNTSIKGSAVGNRVQYTPSEQYQASVGLETAKGFSVEVSGVHTGMMYSDAANTESGSANGQTGVIPAYTVYNISTSQAFTPRLIGFASIKNLFDLTYIASRNPEGIMPGNSRIIEAGITYHY
ncbi:MAG: TonB-dependent receptor [bacterium]|nr:TonB-dependent receptor [bacterium]